MYKDLCIENTTFWSLSYLFLSYDFVPFKHLACSILHDHSLLPYLTSYGSRFSIKSTRHSLGSQALSERVE